MQFRVEFDFDAEGERPRVLVSDDAGPAIEVYEEPTCRHPSGWSWKDEDWVPGPLAARIVELLNGDGGDAEDDDGDDDELDS